MLELKLRDKIISTNRKAFIVGILNATDDSFYEKSRGGAELAKKLISDGADILDIGAESTRPGFTEVSAEDEIKRLVPIIKEIRKKSDIPISVDTRKLEVIKACVAEGADIWNDVTALGRTKFQCRTDSLMGDNACGEVDVPMDDVVYDEVDAEKVDFVAQSKIPVILTHAFPFERETQTRPRLPEQMGVNVDASRLPEQMGVDVNTPKLPEQVSDDILATVSNFFYNRISILTSHGIEKSKIILDPGIGFGKTFAENMTLIKQCGKICISEYQIMMACSRKRCIGEMISDMNADRLKGTIQANRWAVESGAKFIRVHDVKEHCDF